MSDNERHVRFTVSSDTSKAAKGIEDLRRRFSSIGAAAKSNTTEASKLDRAFEDMRKTTKAAADDFKKINDELRKAAQQSENVKPGRGRSGGGNDEKAFGREEVGDISTFSGAIASVVGEMDDGSGVILRFAGDFAGFLEYVPLAQAAITSFYASLNPVTAVLAGVAIGVGLFVGNLIAQQEELNRSIAASIQANADVERQIGEGLTSDQARQRIEELKRAREAELQIVQRETDARNRAAKAASDQLGILGGAATAFINATSGAEEKSSEIQKEAEANAAAMDAEINRLSQSLETGELAANDAAGEIANFVTESTDAVKGLFADIQAEITALQEVANKTATGTASAIQKVQELINNGLTFDQLTAEMQKVEDQIAIQEEVQRRLAAQGYENTDAYRAAGEEIANLNITLTELQLNSTYAAVALNEATAAQKAQADSILGFLGGLGGTITDGLGTISEGLTDFAESVGEYKKQQDALGDQITKINEQAAKQVIAEQSRLVQAQIDAAKEIANLQAQAHADDIKEEAAYLLETNRRRRDFRTEQKRLEEDFYASRFEDILSGNIASVILNERDLKTNKKRNRQDFKTENADASEDFEIEQAAQEEALQARIAQIQAELDEETKASQAKIDEIRAASAVEIGIEQQKFNEKYGYIQQESAAQTRAHQLAISGIESIAAAASRFFSIGASGSRSSTSSTGLPFNIPGLPFAEGGFIPAGGNPLLGLFERKSPEVVIPLESEVGRRLFGGGAVGGGMTVNIPVNVTVSGTGTGEGAADLAAQIAAELQVAIPEAFAQYTEMYIEVTSQGGQ